jgi:predicted RNase H-like HicB family nuclease
MALAARPTWPGWRTLARWGVPVAVRVEICFDQEAGVYFVADSNLKGLHVEAETLDEMKQEILEAAGELLQSRFDGNPPRTDTKIIMHSAAHCAA